MRRRDSESANWRRKTRKPQRQGEEMIGKKSLTEKGFKSDGKYRLTNQQQGNMAWQTEQGSE